jgi:hypothetical protein
MTSRGPLGRLLSEGLIVLFAYSAIAVVVTWPLTPYLETTVIGDPASDMGGTVSWLWTLTQEGGYHIFGASRHTLTGAPLGWEQGNAVNLQWLLPYFPAYLMALLWGEVVAYNVTILTGLVLSSLAMYTLARRLGCTPLVAGWSGLVFMLFPWHVWRVNVGHASLLHLEVFPLLFLALHAWVRSPVSGRAMLVGAAAAGAWLVSGYWGAMAVIGAVAFAMVATVLRTRSIGLRQAGSQLGFVVLSTLLGTTVVGLISLPGRSAGGITMPRTPGDLSVLGARPAEFLVPAAENPFLASATSSVRPGLHGSNPVETTLFMGWLTIALALLWLGYTLRRRRILSGTTVATSGGLLASVLAGLAFATPSPIGIGEHLFSWTPSWFLLQVVPEIRIPSRFLALISAALIPLAALGLQLTCNWVRSWITGSSRARIAALATAATALVLSVVELFPNVWDQTQADQLPMIYEAVERTPSGVLSEYPMDEGSDYKFWQRLHGRPLLNGARIGTDADDLARGVVDPASPGTAEVLSLLGVTGITTRADALDYTDRVPDVPNADWGAGYQLVERFADGSSVWRVVARAAPAVAVLPASDFAAPGRPQDGFIGYAMLRSTGKIRLRSKRSGPIHLSFETKAPENPDGRLRIRGAVGEVSVPLAGRRHVSLAVSVPRGQSRLKVTVEPPLGLDQPPDVELSAPRASRTRQRPTLRAEPVSGDPGF